jgi:uncharacterized protein DUF6152
MMRSKLLLAAAGFLVATAPAMGHHAFGGEFDPNKPVLLKGKVVKLEWVNPHAWIHVEIAKADGAVACQFTPNAKCDEWMVEGGTPNTLLRRGITRDSLKTGTELVIDGYQARDHSLLRANGRNVTYPDGKKLFLGSSGTGAPTDGSDPAEAPKGRGRGGR